MDHMVDHKTSFNKFKRTEIIQNMLFDNNGTKLKVSNKGNVENSQMSENKQHISDQPANESRRNQKENKRYIESK